MILITTEDIAADPPDLTGTVHGLPDLFLLHGLPDPIHRQDTIRHRLLRPDLPADRGSGTNLIQHT